MSGKVVAISAAPPAEPPLLTEDAIAPGGVPAGYVWDREADIIWLPSAGPRSALASAA